MRKYIANQTIKMMIANDKKIKNSTILILGYTFKEDCPDTRNTKVVDIIDELNTYGCNVAVYDPWVAPKGVSENDFFQIIKNPLKGIEKYDSIVVAVAHKEFKALKQADYQQLSKENPVLIDIKGIVEQPNWRL